MQVPTRSRTSDSHKTILPKQGGAFRRRSQARAELPVRIDLGPCPALGQVLDQDMLLWRQKGMVGEEGLEPSSPCGERILSKSLVQNVIPPEAEHSGLKRHKNAPDGDAFPWAQTLRRMLASWQAERLETARSESRVNPHRKPSRANGGETDRRGSQSDVGASPQVPTRLSFRQHRGVLTPDRYVAVAWGEEPLRYE